MFKDSMAMALHGLTSENKQNFQTLSLTEVMTSDRDLWFAVIERIQAEYTHAGDE